jgi:SWIM zinc finger
MNLSVEQVLALAPDASSAAAGKKLATAAVWSDLGANEVAIWGECRGSALYQVRIDRADLAAKCSCPSRKLPCKHTIGLLVLAATTPAKLSDGNAPEWVSEWLLKRAGAAAKKGAKRQEAEAPPDPEAQAKRAAKRQARVLEGIELLDLWLADLVRNGLAGIEAQGPTLWHKQAARLVDAQAPGLAARVRRLAELPGAPGWEVRLLGELGRLTLLTHAFRRLDQLPMLLQKDVQGLVGYTLEREEVIAHGDIVRDHWHVLGMTEEQEDRLRVQRTWLAGIDSGRQALILQFSAANSPFAERFLPDSPVDADLAFWPSTSPLRALVRERRPSNLPRRPIPTVDSIETFLRQWATALAANPWIDRVAFAGQNLLPRRSGDDRWFVEDRAGHRLPLRGNNGWRLLALSGGHAIRITGEWDGHSLLALAAAPTSGSQTQQSAA